VDEKKAKMAALKVEIRAFCFCFFEFSLKEKMSARAESKKAVGGEATDAGTPPSDSGAVPEVDEKAKKMQALKEKMQQRTGSKKQANDETGEESGVAPPADSPRSVPSDDKKAALKGLCLCFGFFSGVF
jgi:hypothetical protein